MTPSGFSVFAIKRSECRSEIVVRATDGTDAMRKARVEGYRLDKDRLRIVCDDCFADRQVSS